MCCPKLIRGKCEKRKHLEYKHIPLSNQSLMLVLTFLISQTNSKQMLFPISQFKGILISYNTVPANSASESVVT